MARCGPELLPLCCQQKQSKASPSDMCAACLQLRYANNSQYKNDTMIRKEVFVTKTVLEELKRIINESEVSSAPGVGLCAVCRDAQLVLGLATPSWLDVGRLAVCSLTLEWTLPCWGVPHTHMA